MRISRYIVTAQDYVGPEGRGRRLAIVPKDQLTEKQRLEATAEQIDKLLKLLRKDSK